MVSYLNKIITPALFLWGMLMAINVASQGIMESGFMKSWYPIDSLSKQAVPLAPLRHADVFWSRRVWRIIDMREKINQPLYYPIEPSQGRVNLICALFAGAFADRLRLFRPDEDRMQVSLTKEEILSLLFKNDTIRQRFDPVSGEGLPDTVIRTIFNPADVVQYRIIEDWFFDCKRSVMEVRILGLCPLKEEYDSQGDLKGTRPLFWVYFPEARQWIVKYPVFNRQNDESMLTFDDLFQKRMFSSYIVKVSDVYDRYINTYALGIDGLLESDRMMQSIIEYEFDLWEY